MTHTASRPDRRRGARARIGIDEEGFKAEMEKQRARAKEASSFGVNYNDVLKLDFETPLPVTNN